MNQLALVVTLLPLTLCAAEVWESKAFQDWSDKDLQRVVTNSPWARPARAVVTGSAAAPPARGGATPGAESPSPGDPTVSRGGLTGGNAGSPGGLGADLNQGTQSTQTTSAPVVIRWETARPLRQAQMRAKYGKEAATSPEAQKFLAQEPALYLVAISGLSGAIVSGGAGDQAKERITKSTTLTPRGSAPIHPLGVEFAPHGQGVDVLIGFPRSVPIPADAQEVELTSQIGTATVKYKFKLKDMIFAGKLEL